MTGAHNNNVGQVSKRVFDWRNEAERAGRAGDVHAGGRGHVGGANIKRFGYLGSGHKPIAGAVNAIRHSRLATVKFTSHVKTRSRLRLAAINSC